MCYLADADIQARMALQLRPEQRIYIEPLGEDAIQPGSVDVRLGEQMDILMPRYGVVNPNNPDTFIQQAVDVEDDGGWLLVPGFLYLATTLETIHVPEDLTAQLQGKSTKARLGVVPHQQAGLLPAGWFGRPTLEITVVYPTRLCAGLDIAQVTFTSMSCTPARPYGHSSRKSRYQGDMHPTMARAKPLKRWTPDVESKVCRRVEAGDVWTD